MFKRSNTLAIAVLGVFLLSVAFAGTARAEIYMVSPTSVETPTVIVLASDEPDVTAGCAQGEPDPNNNGLAIQNTISESGCGMRLIKRTGPDANGLFYYRYRMIMAPPGSLIIQAWSDTSGSYQDWVGKGFPFTVTGNRLRYGDFRTCIDFRTGKALIAWYARITTEIVFQVERKVRRKQKPRKMVWKRWKPKRQRFKIGRDTGEALYSRRYARFRVPSDLVRNVRNNNERKRLIRAKYAVKRGKKILEQGWVSRRLCRQLPFPPYVLP